MNKEKRNHAELLFAEKQKATQAFVKACIETLKNIIPEGRELHIGLSDYDCGAAFFIKDNACRAPYPEWWPVFPTGIRHKDGVLEIRLGSDEAPYYESIEECHYRGWEESVESIYFRVTSIFDGCNMDTQTKFELTEA